MVFSAVHSVIIHEVPSETLEEGIGPIRENPDKAILRSPQETIIAAALKRTQVDANLFLETASKALTDQDGRYFQRVAQSLAAYSQKVAPLQFLRL